MANENDKERNLALADGDNTQSKEDTKNEQELEFKIELKKVQDFEKKKSYTRRVPSIQNLEKDVLQCIIGQDKQVRQIITAIYRSIKLKNIKSNVLIIGNSGTGKTETIKQVAKRLNIPYTIEDATKYTQEGYYGNNVEDMVYNLIDNANGDLERAEKGIIVIDEIDKKAGRGIERDVAGAEVLKSLLKIIEGTTIAYISPENIINEEFTSFDTKNLIIIFLGAFEGLEEIRQKRLNQNPLGFVKNADVRKTDERYLKKDLVEYGMPEEFVGRIDTIIEMNKLDKENLTLIMKKSKLSVFLKYENELKRKGLTLVYDEEKLFENIAEASLELDTGARELANTVNYIFENIIYDILVNPKKYTKCILDSGIVYDNTKYQLS